MEELAVFNWPGLDQKAELFTQTALAGELLMVYVKNGAAQLSAADEDDRAVSEGELVMISDGEVRWSPTSDGGVTLLSTTTTNRVVDEARLEVENAGLWAKISNSLGAGAAGRRRGRARRRLRPLAQRGRRAARRRARRRHAGFVRAQTLHRRRLGAACTFC